jgi:BirA family biotin operon repressor/biotin-[acetyl-CoA-carboxylase] ligase
MATGHAVSRPQLIARLLAHLESLYHTFQQVGIAPILQQWLHYGQIVGRRVRFCEASDVREGTVLGLHEDGALLVQTADGTYLRIISGEVVFL